MSRLAPYLLLAPGGTWLVIFFAIPMALMLLCRSSRAPSTPATG